jgi:hypothetical protein
MSDILSKLTAVGRPGVIPGHTLAPLTLKAMAEAEQHVQQWHVAAAVAGVPASREAAVRSNAAADAALWYRYGTSLFEARTRSATGRQLLVYLSLQGSVKDLDWETAGELANLADADALTEAVEWYWGWAPATSVAGEASTTARLSPGATSSTSSSSDIPAGPTLISRT